MEEHLYTLLSSAVSFPIRRGRVGSGIATPRAVITISGGSQDYHMSGPGAKQTRVQIVVYGRGVAEMKVAADAIENLLSGHKDSVIHGAFLDTWFDRNADDVEILDSRTLVFLINHSAATG